MPTPRPEMSVVTLGGREAGVEEQLGGARGVDRRDGLLGVISPRSAALRATRAGSMPRPSSATVMTTLPPAWRAEISSTPVGGLAGRDALLRRPRGRGRARCARGARAGRRARRRPCGRARSPCRRARSSTSLPSLVEQVADQAREAQEDGLDRDHPDLHDHRLQRLRGAREVLHRLREARARRRRRRAPRPACGAATSSPMKCMSWSRRSASTRTVGGALGGARPPRSAAAPACGAGSRIACVGDGRVATGPRRAGDLDGVARRPRARRRRRAARALVLVRR